MNILYLPSSLFPFTTTPRIFHVSFIFPLNNHFFPPLFFTIAHFLPFLSSSTNISATISFLPFFPSWTIPNAEHQNGRDSIKPSPSLVDLDSTEDLAHPRPPESPILLVREVLLREMLMVSPPSCRRNLSMLLPLLVSFPP